jgi:hypothetical protein
VAPTRHAGSSPAFRTTHSNSPYFIDYCPFPSICSKQLTFSFHLSRFVTDFSVLIAAFEPAPRGNRARGCEFPVERVNKMSRAIAAVLLMCVLAASAYAGGIKSETLTAYSNGSSIVVRWVSDDEQGLQGYKIERRADGRGSFVQLTDSYIVPRGNGSSYEFVDNSVFRVTDSYYVYCVTAVGSASEPCYVTVRHSTRGVRRTWGSIKAMFR